MKSHSQTVVQLGLVEAALAFLLAFVQPVKAASWATNSPMNTARMNHAAVLLHNGKVMVVGGFDGTNVLFSAELYDPANGTWVNTGQLKTARRFHTATMLPNGKVLVAGGLGGNNAFLASAELYDPVSGTWTNTVSMTTNRFAATALLLPQGKVLIAGGQSTSNIFLASGELFDPANETWTKTTNSMASARSYYTTTLLRDGKVYAAGNGFNGTNFTGTNFSADLFDPSIGKWSPTGNMRVARRYQSATLLPNGRVLVTGGQGNTLRATNSAELYDPTSGTSALTGSMSTARQWHTASLLPNGQVLVSGGQNGTNAIATNALASAELFDFGSGTWTPTSNTLTAARYWHTATVLSNGKVLITGGSNGTNALSNTEIYDPVGVYWTTINTMITPRWDHTATLLTNGQVLIVAGNNLGTVPGVEIFNPANGIWTATNPLATPRWNHTATLLTDGRVLITGGYGGDDSGSTIRLSSVEIYDQTAGTWSPTIPLLFPREGHTATLLSNGKVLVVGGAWFDNEHGTIVYPAGTELFDPSSGNWTLTGSLNTPRAYHSATLLPDGKVLVAGGYYFDGANHYPTRAELYDPTSGLWAETGALNNARRYHTETLLANGQVLVTGGQYLSSVELYNPTNETWTLAPAMKTSRYNHTATLLPSGKVLVVGGNNATTSSGLSSAELYDPLTQTWAAAGTLPNGYADHTATLLFDGQVLVCGGGGQGIRAEMYGLGLGFNVSYQPQITTITTPLNLGDRLIVTGSKFRGISGASNGNSQDSSSNYPLVQLSNIQSGQIIFLLSTNWSTNSFTSLPVWNFPPGNTLVTVFVNGIPSASSSISIPVPVPNSPTITDAKKLTNGTFQFDFTNSVGAVFSVLTSTNVSLPLSNWTALSGVTEISPGQFQFTDPQATNSPQRFYRVRAN